MQTLNFPLRVNSLLIYNIVVLNTDLFCTLGDFNTMDRNEMIEKIGFEQFKTQSDYLADRLKQLITQHEFAEDFIFPNENEFCKMLNVSRGTLRDAYKKLDTQGFIERTKQGTYIKRKAQIAEEGNFSACLELATLSEMTEFILTFEPEAARLAAEKIDDEGLCILEQLMLDCEANANDNKELNRTNYEFHNFIRSQAKNALVTSILSAYYDTFSKNIIDMIYYLLKEDSDNFRDNALQQHREILDAFKCKDGERVRILVREHLEADLKTYATLKGITKYDI